MSEPKPQPSRPALSLKKKLAFSAATVLIVFAFLEIAARLAGVRPLDRDPDIPYIDSPHAMEWELRPNAETTWPPGPSGVAVRTNEFGLRDDAIPPKPAGERRVLFLGDSVVFGSRLPQDRTIPEQLERRLGEGARVINAGVEGYGTFQERALLRTKGFEMEPDIVILGYVLNDPWEQYRTMKRFGGKGGYMGAGRKSLGRAAGALLFKSAALTWAKLAFERARRGGGGDGGAAYAGADRYNVSEMFKDPLEPFMEEAWAESLAELAAMKADCDARGAPLLVVLFPYLLQYDDATVNPLGPNRRLAEFCEAEGIAFLDLYEAVGAADDREALYYFIEHEGVRDGTHFSVEGAAFAAERIAEKMNEMDF